MLLVQLLETAAKLQQDLRIIVESSQRKYRCENQIYQIKPTQLVRNNLLVLAKGKYFSFSQYLEIRSYMQGWMIARKG